MKYLALILAFALSACAARQQPPPPCQKMYVLLPDNFIIDLAAGARVIVDPAIQDIAVFCRPEEARARLQETAPPGSWAVYEIEGDSGEMVQPTASGEYKLARPAQIADWISK